MGTQRPGGGRRPGRGRRPARSLLTGPRQVGKTTLLRRLCGPDRRYATLDDPALRTLAREDPALFLQRFRPPVLIDEVQYGPELLPHVKMAIDQDRRPGAFWPQPPVAEPSRPRPAAGGPGDGAAVRRSLTVWSPPSRRPRASPVGLSIQEAA